jgi:DNA-binding NarL/FixJ family response regulator
MTAKVRIMLVSHAPMTLEGLYSLLHLSPSIEIVAQERTAKPVLDRIQRITLDLIILDSQLPDAVDLVQAIGTLNFGPVPRVLAFGGLDPAVILPLIHAGVAGYALTIEPGKSHVHAILQVARGRAYYGPGVTEIIVAHARQQSQAPASLAEPLSPREMEALTLLDQGMSDKQLAQALKVKLSTAKGYMAEIRRKLNASSRGEALAKARALGLLPRGASLP